MKQSNTKRIALMGMLFALAIVLSFVESVVTGAMGLPPGVKIGLANIVVMYALLCMSPKDAFALVALKALFNVLTRGAIAGALSLAGGLLSLVVLLLLCALKQKDEYLILSISSAIAHNIGQLLMIRVLTASQYTIYYLPVLLISGLVMGIVTALSLKAVMPILEKMNLKK